MSDSSQIAPQLGRRERKRRRTHQMIERAAVALACEKGYGNVVVADVCERVDIARSTFFTHMPSLDAAIFGAPLRMIPWKRAWSILEADAGHLPRALHRVSMASVGGLAIDPVVLAGRRRLILEQPDTAVRAEATFIPLRHDLIGLTVAWLDAHPERAVLGGAKRAREAVLLVNASGAVASALMEQWADDAAAEARDAAADFDAAFADLRAVLAACG